MKYANLGRGKGFSPVRSLLYYSQRVVTIPRLRALVVGIIAAGIRYRLGPCRQRVHETLHLQLDQLREDGYLPLGSLLSDRQCDDITNFLEDKILTDRHGAHRKFKLADKPDDTCLSDYLLEDIINSPHLLALANGAPLLHLAEHYIGCRPTISALTLRWSTPTAIAASNLLVFHRDADDWRYLKVMVYLSDVGPDEGPHVFVKGSHRTQASIKLTAYSDASVAASHTAERVETVLGKRGTAFVVDTAGIHKGTVPTGKSRLMLQIQYSLLPTYFYDYEPARYHGTFKVDRYINRLIVAP